MNNMNLDTAVITAQTTQTIQNNTNSVSKQKNDTDISFSDELKNSKQETGEKENTKTKKEEVKIEKQTNKKDEISNKESVKEELNKTIPNNGEYENKGKELSELENSMEFLAVAVKEINILQQKDEEKEEIVVIDNNMNIPEPQNKVNLQMGGMNFNNNENKDQQFSDYINSQAKDKLKVSEAELAEEKEILSTMSENIAIANKNMLNIKETQEKNEVKTEEKVETIINNEGIKKVDKKTDIVVDTIVKYDNVIMTKEDVNFFVNLVQNNIVEINSLQDVKASNVSKTLADLIAKAKEDNKPIRIDFDNDISVIIKISREGKLSADFLPSSQIAEAYLRDNLPILRQKFDDNNIEYDELNQRKQKQDNNKEDRKKGSKDE